MLKSTSVYTFEIDDSARAVAELKAQLDGFVRLEHTVGILLCDPEFIASGTARAVCAALDFPVAGATTMCQALPGRADMLLLTLMVLTSDDVRFEVGMTDSLEDGIEAPTREAYRAARARLGEDPRLIIAFPPLFLKYAGDAYIDIFEELCGKVPVFGSLAIDDSGTYDETATIGQGETSHWAMAFILVAGPINPRFQMATISDRKTLPYAGEVTGSRDNIIYRINDASPADYFTGIGLARDGVLDPGVQFIPFLMDIKSGLTDGIPVVRALVQFDSDGNAICRGRMYQDSLFKIATCDKEDVLSTTLSTLESINEMPDVNAVLIFSCMVRRLAFGLDLTREANAIARSCQVPFMMGYAGGELCPTSVGEQGAVNRFHNYSLIACIL